MSEKQNPFLAPMRKANGKRAVKAFVACSRLLVRQILLRSRSDREGRVERSHEATRFRERGMRRFKSDIQAQRLVDGSTVRTVSGGA